ncbi:ankyrin repeat domain-containing protein [Sphingomonas lenta]|uniref:ankyrin repeat domain-containing protein n=1 Tax=Sphingomonas lenta TaxID=1141887 RepID=UPI001140EF4F|nr:hypothetical protein [Sphingomonas lenta]
MSARFLLAAALLVTAACQNDAQASCFVPEAVLPKRDATLTDPKLGQSARDLAEALYDRDLPRAERLLAADPALATVRVGERHSMLTVALATCEPRAVDLLIRRGAPLDVTGDGGTLQLALMAKQPDFALALLKAGAKPMPPESPLGPVDIATALGSMGGVRMLLDFGLDPKFRDRLGNSPLGNALDADRFEIAELLLDRGADPWAIDVTGGNLAYAVTMPMMRDDPDDEAAQKRLAARLPKLGWPTPHPSPAEIRRLALDGRWPPAHAKAPPVPEGVLAVMAENARRESGARTQ